MSGYSPAEHPLGWILRYQKVNEPVSSYHGQWMADMLSFLLAHKLALVANIYPKRYAHATTASELSFPYWKSEGARALIVGVDAFGPGDCKITVSSSGVSMIDAGSPPLDGSTAFRGSTPASTPNPHLAILDATDFSGLSTIRVLRTPVSRTYGFQVSGIQRVFALEVPRSLIDPVRQPTTDVSFNRAWPIPPGKLVDGSASTSRGFKRVVSQLLKARASVRQHRTLATLEDTTNAWHISSTSYTPLIVDAEWYWRARRAYDNATANPHKLYVRYQSDQAWTLRIKTTVNGSATNNDYVYSAHAGSFTADSTQTLNVSTAHSTSGHEQEVKVEIQAKLNTAGNLYVSCVSAVENET